MSDAIISGLSRSPGPISHWRFPAIKPGGPPFHFHFLFIIGTNFGSILYILATNLFWLIPKLASLQFRAFFFNIQHRSHFLRMRPCWKATMQFGWYRCLAKTPWHLLSYLWIWWTVVATLEVQPARLMPSHEYPSTAHVEVIIPEKGRMSWVMTVVSWGCVKDHVY